MTNRIGYWAARRGWTDGETAARAGLSRPRLNRIKNRGAEPRVSEALRLAAALRVSLSEAFPDADQPTCVTPAGSTAAVRSPSRIT